MQVCFVDQSSLSFLDQLFAYWLRHISLAWCIIIVCSHGGSSAAATGVPLLGMNFAQRCCTVQQHGLNYTAAEKRVKYNVWDVFTSTDDLYVYCDLCWLQDWHKSCFSCASCHKTLEIGKLSDRDGEIYCRGKVVVWLVFGRVLEHNQSESVGHHWFLLWHPTCRPPLNCGTSLRLFSTRDLKRHSCFASQKHFGQLDTCIILIYVVGNAVSSYCLVFIGQWLARLPYGINWLQSMCLSVNILSSASWGGLSSSLMHCLSEALPGMTGMRKFKWRISPERWMYAEKYWRTLKGTFVHSERTL